MKTLPSILITLSSKNVTPFLRVIAKPKQAHCGHILCFCFPFFYLSSLFFYLFYILFFVFLTTMVPAMQVASFLVWFMYLRGWISFYSNRGGSNRWNEALVNQSFLLSCFSIASTASSSSASFFFIFCSFSSFLHFSFLPEVWYSCGGVTPTAFKLVHLPGYQTVRSQATSWNSSFSSRAQRWHEKTMMKTQSSWWNTWKVKLLTSSMRLLPKIDSSPKKAETMKCY